MSQRIPFRTTTKLAPLTSLHAVNLSNEPCYWKSIIKDQRFVKHSFHSSEENSFKAWPNGFRKIWRLRGRGMLVRTLFSPSSKS